MRLYKLGAYTKTGLKVHVIWIPKFWKRALLGSVAIRASDVLRESAFEHEVEIISGKVAKGHINMLFWYLDARASGCKVK